MRHTAGNSGGSEEGPWDQARGVHEDTQGRTCTAGSSSTARQENGEPNKAAPSIFFPELTFRQHATELFSAARGRVEGVLSSTAGALRRGWAWARGILPPRGGGGGDPIGVAAPAPRWGEGGASAGTPLPGDRPMVAPEDTTAEALPSEREMNF